MTRETREKMGSITASFSGEDPGKRLHRQRRQQHRCHTTTRLFGRVVVVQEKVQQVTRQVVIIRRSHPCAHTFSFHLLLLLFLPHVIFALSLPSSPSSSSSTASYTVFSSSAIIPPPPPPQTVAAFHHLSVSLKEYNEWRASVESQRVGEQAVSTLSGTSSSGRKITTTTEENVPDSTGDTAGADDDIFPDYLRAENISPLFEGSLTSPTSRRGSLEDLIASLGVDDHEKTTYDLLFGDNKIAEDPQMEENASSQQTMGDLSSLPQPLLATTSGDSSREVQSITSSLSELKIPQASSSAASSTKTTQKRKSKKKKSKKKKGLSSPLLMLMQAARQLSPNFMLPILASAIPKSVLTTQTGTGGADEVTSKIVESVDRAETNPGAKPKNHQQQVKEQTSPLPGSAAAAADDDNNVVVVDVETHVLPSVVKNNGTSSISGASSALEAALRRSKSASSSSSTSELASALPSLVVDADDDNSSLQNSNSPNAPSASKSMIVVSRSPLLNSTANPSEDADLVDKPSSFIIAPASFVIESLAPLYKEFEENGVKALLQRRKRLPSFKTISKRRLPRSVFLEVDENIDGVKRYKVEGDPDEKSPLRVKRNLFGMQGELQHQQRFTFPYPGIAVPQQPQWSQMPISFPPQLQQQQQQSSLGSLIPQPSSSGQSRSMQVTGPTSSSRNELSLFPRFPQYPSMGGAESDNNNYQQRLPPPPQRPTVPVAYNEWKAPQNQGFSHLQQDLMRGPVPNTNSAGARMSNFNMPGVAAVIRQSSSSDDSVFKMPMPVKDVREKVEASKSNPALTTPMMMTSYTQLQQRQQQEQRSYTPQPRQQLPQNFQTQLGQSPQFPAQQMNSVPQQRQQGQYPLPLNYGSSNYFPYAQGQYGSTPTGQYNSNPSYPRGYQVSPNYPNQMMQRPSKGLERPSRENTPFPMLAPPSLGPSHQPTNPSLQQPTPYPIPPPSFYSERASSIPPANFPRNAGVMPPPSLYYSGSSFPVSPSFFPENAPQVSSPPSSAYRTGSVPPMSYYQNEQNREYIGRAINNQPSVRAQPPSSNYIQPKPLKEYLYPMQNRLYGDPFLKGTASGYGRATMGGIDSRQGAFTGSPYPNSQGYSTTGTPTQPNPYMVEQRARYDATQQRYSNPEQHQQFNYQQTGLQPQYQQRALPSSPFQRQFEQPVESSNVYSKAETAGSGSPFQAEKQRQYYGAFPNTRAENRIAEQQYFAYQQQKQQDKAPMAKVDRSQAETLQTPQRMAAQSQLYYLPGKSGGGVWGEGAGATSNPPLFQSPQIAATIPQQKFLRPGGERQAPVSSANTGEQRVGAFAKQSISGPGTEPIKHNSISKIATEFPRSDGDGTQDIYSIYNLEKSKIDNNKKPPAAISASTPTISEPAAGSPEGNTTSFFRAKSTGSQPHTEDLGSSGQGGTQDARGTGPGGSRSEFTLPIIDSPQGKSKLQIKQPQSSNRESQQQQQQGFSGKFAGEQQPQASAQQHEQQTKWGNHKIEEPNTQTGKQQQEFTRRITNSGDDGPFDLRTGQYDHKSQPSQLQQQYQPEQTENREGSARNHIGQQQQRQGSTITEEQAEKSRIPGGGGGNVFAEGSNSPFGQGTGRSEHLPKTADRWNNTYDGIRGSPPGGSTGDRNNNGGEATSPHNSETPKSKSPSQKEIFQRPEMGGGRHEFSRKHLPHHGGDLPFYSQSEVDAQLQRMSHNAPTVKDTEFENDSAILSWYLQRAKQKLRDRPETAAHKKHDEEASTGHETTRLGSIHEPRAVRPPSIQQSNTGTAEFNVTHPYSPDITRDRSATSQYNASQASISPTATHDRGLPKVSHPSQMVQAPANTTTNYGSAPSSQFQSHAHQNGLPPFSRTAPSSPASSTSFTSSYPVGVQGHGSHLGLGRGRELQQSSQQLNNKDSTSQSYRIPEQDSNNNPSRSKRGIRNPYEWYFP